MPNNQDIAKTVHRYVELVAQGRADDVVSLYADDAVVEDPVGAERHVGREAIRRFYSAIEGAQSEAEVRTLRVSGNEAAFLVRWTMTSMGIRLEPIDVIAVDDDGKITSLKAYWSADEATPLS